MISFGDERGPAQTRFFAPPSMPQATEAEKAPFKKVRRLGRAAWIGTKRLPSLPIGASGTAVAAACIAKQRIWLGSAEDNLRARAVQRNVVALLPNSPQVSMKFSGGVRFPFI
jgi:hypothetical protein